PARASSTAHRHARKPPPNRRRASATKIPKAFSSGCAVEAVAARTRARGARVVDREALLLDGVHEVDDRGLHVRRGPPVRRPPPAGELAEQVTVHLTLVKKSW